MRSYCCVYARYFATTEPKIKVPIKYIDPSYMVRSVPANANDAVMIYQLSQNAVHGAMVRSKQPLASMPTTILYMMCALSCWSGRVYAIHDCACQQPLGLPSHAICRGPFTTQNQSERSHDRAPVGDDRTAAKFGLQIMTEAEPMTTIWWMRVLSCLIQHIIHQQAQTRANSNDSDKRGMDEFVSFRTLNFYF